MYGYTALAEAGKFFVISLFIGLLIEVSVSSHDFANIILCPMCQGIAYWSIGDLLGVLLKVNMLSLTAYLTCLVKSAK